MLHVYISSPLLLATCIGLDLSDVLTSGVMPLSLTTLSVTVVYMCVVPL